MKQLALLLLVLPLAACTTPQQASERNCGQYLDGEGHLQTSCVDPKPLPAPWTERALARAQLRAKAEDCQVIAAIARGRPASNRAAPMNAKSAGAACDWKALGFSPPEITTEEYPILSYSYSKPVYSADGMQARVQWSYGGDERSRGHPERYFYTGGTCTAVKQHGHWEFGGCSSRFIT